jgi:malonyl CoA-acyl carrier protein transacylase
VTARTAAVVFPGRGTYNREQLGYLARHHANKRELLEGVDGYRRSLGQLSVSELDAMSRYDAALHSVGENVSAIIYACAVADFADIDRDRFEIVAVTGNSMGWYLALAGAGVLAPSAAITVVNTMGSMMRDRVIGGQLVYPLVDSEWRLVPERQDQLNAVLRTIGDRNGAELYLSIDLGGIWVLGGNKTGLDKAARALPQIDRYPMRLPNHAAFHTPLMDSVVGKAQSALPRGLFQNPELALVDGHGAIWQPYATDGDALYDYTLGAQINQPYNFSLAVEVVLKEFAPEVLIVPGPGTSLVPPIAQEMIKLQWVGITCRSDFLKRQAQDPMILAMGVDEQRRAVLAA